VIDGVPTGPEAHVRGSQLWRSRGARLGWILAGGPAALLAVALLHALHLRIYLGRWPVVYRDNNPETLLLRIHECGFLVPALYGSFFGVPVWLLIGAILVATRLLEWRVFRKQIGLMLAGIVGVILFVALDPSGYVEWFLD